MNTKLLPGTQTKASDHAGWRVGLLVPCMLATLMAGCLSRPALERQTFALQSGPVVTNAPVNAQAQLAIRSLEVCPLFESRAFIYRTGADRYEPDPYASFLVSPSRALAVAIRGYLRNSGAFKSVAEPASALETDTSLEIHVGDLYGDFRPSGPPTAVLSMRLLFFDAVGEKTRQPFLEKTYMRRVPLQQKNAAALVAGWNLALAQIMDQVTSDLGALPPRQRGL